MLGSLLLLLTLMVYLIGWGGFCPTSVLYKGGFCPGGILSVPPPSDRLMVDHHEDRKPDPSWIRRPGRTSTHLALTYPARLGCHSPSHHPLPEILRLQGDMDTALGNRRPWHGAV